MPGNQSGSVSPINQLRRPILCMLHRKHFAVEVNACDDYYYRKRLLHPSGSMYRRVSDYNRLGYSLGIPLGTINMRVSHGVSLK